MMLYHEIWYEKPFCNETKNCILGTPAGWRCSWGVAVVMMMMTKSMKYILQEILVGDEGIAGDGSLWPTDLLHCDDQTLVSFDFDQNVTFPIL